LWKLKYILSLNLKGRMYMQVRLFKVKFQLVNMPEHLIKLVKRYIIFIIN